MNGKKVLMPMQRKNRSTWKASAVIPSALEEELLDLVGLVVGGAASTYTDFETRQTVLTLFVASRSEWLGLQSELRAQWNSYPVHPGRSLFPRFHLTRLRQQDWAEVWKRHFRPIRIGKALLVRPPWARCPAVPSRKVVVLEPGLSFGTGQHPTTSFCLKEIVRHRPVRESRSFLDVGTGSGILAIAAAKLGFQPVAGFDLDPDAIRIARENARRNRVEQAVSLSVRDLKALALQTRTRFDLICANLVSNVLLAERDRILSRLRPGGAIVLAGILAQEFGEIERCFGLAGFRLARSKQEKEWRSGTFVKRD